MKCDRCGAEIRAFISLGGQETLVDYSKVTYNTGAQLLINDDGSPNLVPKPGDRGYLLHEPLCQPPGIRHRSPV